MEESEIKLHHGKKKQCSSHISTKVPMSFKSTTDNFKYLCEIIDETIKHSMNFVYKESIETILSHMVVREKRDHLKTLFINANGLSLKLLADGIQDFYSEQRGLRRVAANSIVLNVKLAYCSSLRSVIERIEEKLRKWHDKQITLLVALDKPESFPVHFINNFITIVAEKNYPITLAFFGHTNFTMLYQRIHRDTYSNIEVKYMEFPPAESYLNTFLKHLLTPNKLDEIPLHLQLSGELLKDIRDSYLLEDFSVPNLVKRMHFALFGHCKTTTNSLKELRNCREEWLTFKEKCSTYYNVLDILHTFYRDTSMKENDRDTFVKSSFWDLHILIQTTNDFISATNELYSDCRSRWSSWDIEEWMEKLNMLKMMCENNELLREDVAKFEQFLSDLDNVENRMDEMVLSSPEKHPTVGKSKLSAVEWKKQMDVRRSNAANPFIQEREKLKSTIIHYLDKFFKKFLKPFPKFDESFVVKCPEDIDLIKLRITDEIEFGLAQPDLNINDIQNEQLDVCIAYRCSESDLEIIENVNIDENINGSDSDSNAEAKNHGGQETIEEVELTIDDVTSSLKKQESITDEIISKDSKSSLATSQDQLEEQESDLESQEEETMEKVDEKLENEVGSKENFHEFPQTPLTEEEEELLYGQEARYNAIGNLIFFSILIFTLPLAVMYIVYRILLDNYNWPPDAASLWAGIAAAVVVIVIVAIFVWKALREEQKAEVELKALKKSQ
uniref:Origin recognition complex subunit 3 N-terminal domain-containing protein n=1 Tax=Acrobeloides nanus TaxID=290746 RepID=A0A914BVH5_9BILA